MRTRALGAALLFAVAAAQPAGAQNPLNFEIGAFGQFNSFDKNLNLDNNITIGGRAALYLLRNLALEGDVQYGKTDWTASATQTKEITFQPVALRFVYGIPFADAKARLLIGAGYQLNVYRGRFQNFGGALAANEYEDAFTALVGLKYCLNDRWHLRADVPVMDHNPSPNFTGSIELLDGKSTNYGIRVGIGTMLRGECPGEKYAWSIAVSPPSSNLKPGTTQQVSFTAQDMKARAVAANRLQNVRWTSSNAGVATVDQNGLVTAVAPGSAQIQVCAISKKIEQCATHSATVRELEWRVAVTPTTATDSVGRTIRLTAAATDENNAAVSGTLSWSSSNAAVASVDNAGSVSCRDGGSATITATMSNPNSRMVSGSRSATAQVTCIEPPPPPQPVLVVQLTDVHFGFNQATLTRQGRDTLNWVIQQLTTEPGSGWMVSIEGHTDPYGSDEYNERLADRRATTVMNYLTRRPGRVDAGRVQKSSFGERCLVLQDDHDRPQRSRAEHRENRRVEIWNLNGTQVPSGCRPAEQYRNR